ncbi:MAG: hypothetical protein ABIS86_05545 [Streptosporangiaceae bacterium]
MLGKLLAPALAVLLIVPAGPAWAQEPAAGVLVVELVANRTGPAGEAVLDYYVGEKIKVRGSLRNPDGTPAAGRAVLVSDPRASGEDPAAKAQTLTLRTDEDGLFGGTFTPDADGPLSAPGRVRAVARISDADLVADAASAAGVLSYRTEITGYVPPQDIVPKNAPVVFRGRFRYTDWDGAKKPYTGGVTLFYWDGRAVKWARSASTTADNDGGFWISGQATVHNSWRVQATDAGYDPAYHRQAEVWVEDADGKAAVVEGLTPGGTVRLGTKFTLKGRSWLAGPGTQRTVNAGAEIELGWSSNLRTWHAYTAGRTDAQGRFTFNPVARGDAHWRIVLPGRKVGDHVVRTLERQLYVNTRTASRVTANAGPEPVRRGRKISVRGTAQDYANGRWHLLKKRKVAVYFRKKGTRTWKLVGWARTGTKGRYVLYVKASRDGSWLAYFPADGDHYKTASHPDYVNVR